MARFKKDATANARHGATEAADSIRDADSSRPRSPGGGRSQPALHAVVGLVLLGIGALLGYYARPFVERSASPDVAGKPAAVTAQSPTAADVGAVTVQSPAAADAGAVTAQSPAPADAGSVTAQPGAAAAQANTPSESDASATRQALAASVAARVRHFRGEADAPVTLIEFSDFQ